MSLRLCPHFDSGMSSIAGFDPTLWHRRLALGELILWQWGIASWFFTKIFQFEAPASIKTFLTSSGASYDGAPAHKIFDFHYVHMLELLTNQMDLKLTRKWTGSDPGKVWNMFYSYILFTNETKLHPLHKLWLAFSHF